MRSQKGRQAPGDGGRALVVKTQAVNERSVLSKTKNPRLWIARLGFGGDCAEFGKPESQGGPDQGNCRIFVIAGRQADGIGEAEAPQVLGEPWMAECRRWFPLRRLEQFQGIDGQMVGVFRVESEKQRAQKGIDHAPLYPSFIDARFLCLSSSRV